VLRRIDWSSPASILEKIIRYEAVHEIENWDDLRRRIDPPDRRCYAFFHPALIDEPLIFVEVALTRGIPDAIAPILAASREPVPPESATTAVFYSISNCQRGLAGVTFGHFLIKQVVEEVSREGSKLSTYVTLSPVPRFAEWLKRERANEQSVVAAEDRAALNLLDAPGWWTDEAAVARLHEPMLRAAANYFVHARSRARVPFDPVARFHLGNGASLERINWPADLSERGLSQAYGLMVNYKYDLGEIEENHEAYAEHRSVVASSAVRKMARPAMELVTVAKG
jgi:malonyl-CoA decarboxylase